MKVQRFFAADMRDGMRLVREEMGADAVILSSQRSSGGVEIVATAEYEQASARPGRPAGRYDSADSLNSTASDAPSTSDHEPLREVLGDALTQQILAEAYRKECPETQFETRSPPATRREARAAHTPEQDPIRLPDRLAQKLRQGAALGDSMPAPSAAPRAASAPGAEPAPRAESAPQPAAAGGHGFGADVVEMQAELRSMREMMDQCFGSIAWDAMGVRDPGHAMLVERFVRMGFDGAMARKLAESVPLKGKDDLDWRNALARMSKSIPVVGGDLTDAGGAYALLGPAGSGKTTTIGKLATRYAMRHGADQVALVTMDCNRIGGQDQLRAYGRILNVPVRVVDREHSLQQVMESLRGKRLILIDTAGLNPADRDFDQQLRSLSGCPDVRNLLVLPCTSQALVLRSVCHAHARLNPAGCILTRLDESGQLGGAIGVAMREHLPVAYLTDGQQVPHDLKVARAYSLTSRAVALMQEASAAEYGHELGQAARSKPMALQAG